MPAPLDSSVAMVCPIEANAPMDGLNMYETPPDISLRVCGSAESAGAAVVHDRLNDVETPSCGVA